MKVEHDLEAQMEHLGAIHLAVYRENPAFAAKIADEIVVLFRRIVELKNN